MKRIISPKNTFLNQEFLSPQDIEQYQLCFVGAGYDTSYKSLGLCKAPESIRDISMRYSNGDGTSRPLKVYNPDKGFILSESHIVDCGDMNRCVDLEMGLPSIINTIVEKKGIPFIVGGDHGITDHILKYIRLPEKITVYHIDSHGDYLENDIGFPNGSVMRRVRKIKGIEKIIHIGLHGNLNTGPGLKDSIDEGNTVITLEDIRKKGISGIRRYFSEGKPSFISFDVDFLDPSIAPAVGVPEPDGSSYRMAMDIIDEIIKNTNIVGMDFTEYNPALESNILTGIHVTNLIMESMACVSKNSGKLIK